MSTCWRSTLSQQRNRPRGQFLCVSGGCEGGDDYDLICLTTNSDLGNKEKGENNVKRLVSILLTLAVAVSLCLATAVPVAASEPVAMTIETVPVGNPGNDPDDTGYGAVAYAYNIGKYEVTAGQYTEFLNAVAGTDPYGLYNTGMDSYGCRIERTGTDDDYSYSVASDWANRPMNFVSFWDACRFANWFHNGQGSGDTETGAYTLTADGILNNSVIRNEGWQWAVASEDEWYKAAYHDGLTGNYFDYPTASDSMPSNDLTTPDEGNNANFWQDNDYTLGGPYYRTLVGEFELSESPYGTFDQGGNVWEWNEAGVGSSYRYHRGGGFAPYFAAPEMSYRLLGADMRGPFLPTDERNDVGFRVVSKPGPKGSVGLTTDTGEGIVAISVSPGSIDFGTVQPGQSSDEKTLNVENIGFVPVDVSASLESATPVFDYLRLDSKVNLSSWGITGLVGGQLKGVSAQLVVPRGYAAQGTETATLVFEASPAA